MSCTTILVGRKASNDGSTMIARTEDGHFDVKKLIVVNPKDQPKKYKTKISHLEIELTEKPMRYTACPNVDPKQGVWAATGINEANVGITATETITSNPRVLAADPLVEYKKAKTRREKDVPGGIGEEDIVLLVLPYVRTAREGVKRLGKLLEKYGTYESNGIAINDVNEVWWLETIGGHHWMARRIPDDQVVIAPNQFAMDAFDLKDAFGKQAAFNPRNIFGSCRDMDHIYNTPRAWFMGRYLTPVSHRWEGPEAEFTPESDNIPWGLRPDRKVAPEDVQYLLSSHYQGTDYDPYINRDTGKRGMYRSIGINRTGVTTICQIRPDVPDAIKGIEWICFGSTTFGAFLPFYTAVSRVPDYLSRITLDASTENYYWSSRLIGALADSCYSASVQNIERYQLAVGTKGREIIREYDEKMIKGGDFSLTEEANEKLSAMAEKETTSTLNKVLQTASEKMKNGYNLEDN